MSFFLINKDHFSKWKSSFAIEWKTHEPKCGGPHTYSIFYYIVFILPHMKMNKMRMNLINGGGLDHAYFDLDFVNL